MERGTEEKEEGCDVLDCLHGIKCSQQLLRNRKDGNTERLVREAAEYAGQLPDEVKRRLTEIDIARLRFPGTLEAGKLAEQLASDAAFAQVIRAANVYREKLGFAPFGADGRPVKEKE